MRNKEKDEIPLVYIERNPLIIALSVLMTTGLFYITFKNVFGKEVMDVHPMAFMLIVPSMIFFFQTIWFIVNPFGMIYEDKIEIKWFMLNKRSWYFIDFKKTYGFQKNSLLALYNDGEAVKLNLFGIKPSHKSLLKSEIDKKIEESLSKRQS